jgi:hypothetical protein
MADGEVFADVVCGAAVLVYPAPQKTLLRLQIFMTLLRFQQVRKKKLTDLPLLPFPQLGKLSQDANSIKKHKQKRVVAKASFTQTKKDYLCQRADRQHAECKGADRQGLRPNQATRLP